MNIICWQYLSDYCSTIGGNRSSASQQGWIIHAASKQGKLANNRTVLGQKAKAWPLCSFWKFHVKLFHSQRKITFSFFLCKVGRQLGVAQVWYRERCPQIPKPNILSTNIGNNTNTTSLTLNWTWFVGKLRFSNTCVLRHVAHLIHLDHQIYTPCIRATLPCLPIGVPCNDCYLVEVERGSCRRERESRIYVDGWVGEGEY